MVHNSEARKQRIENTINALLNACQLNSAQTISFEDIASLR